MTGTETTLLGLTRAVAQARDYRAELSAKLRAAREAWEQEHADLIEAENRARKEVSILEGNLRAAATEAVLDTEQYIALPPGIKVRWMRRLEYDRDRAFQWAQEHNLFVTLDEKAFEKYMLVGDRPEWCEVHAEPQITIATDLTKTLAESEGDS